MKVRIALTGTAPLLMHNARLSDPLDPIARAMKAISSKRVKTEDDHEALARLEFEGGLYMDDEVGPYIPGANIERSLQGGAKITKAGKKIERGLFVVDSIVPLLYAGPRTASALWADAAFRSRLSVGVAQSRVMRTRPQFREWSAEADAELDTSVLALDELRSIAQQAGAMAGIGDYRPRYGRYVAEVTRL